MNVERTPRSMASNTLVCTFPGESRESSSMMLCSLIPQLMMLNIPKKDIADRSVERSVILVFVEIDVDLDSCGKGCHPHPRVAPTSLLC